MGINSTEVAYSFGQMGSIHVSGTTAVTSNEVTADPGVGANAVFVAITFLEDTVFENSLAGLTPAIDQLYIGGTGRTSTSIDANGGSITGTETFPEGITIYGRWTGFQLASGRVIAYIGY
jgi:hypothetical protein